MPETVHENKMAPEVTEKTIGKFRFVLSGKKILIFVGDALHEDSTEYPTEDIAQGVWKYVLKAKRVEEV